MSLHEKEATDEKRDIESTTYRSYSTRWSRRLLTWGIEGRGTSIRRTSPRAPFLITCEGTIPVQPEDRIDTQYLKNFFLWFSFNCNILSFSAGSLGPIVFGLGVKDSCLVILFFNLLCALPPAYLCVPLSSLVYLFSVWLL